MTTLLVCLDVLCFLAPVQAYKVIMSYPWVLWCGVTEGPVDGCWPAQMLRGQALI